MLSDGVGIIIPPKDEEALLNAMREVLANNFKINQIKRKRLIDSFDYSKQAIRLKNVLKEN